MLRTKILILAATILAADLAVLPDSAEAGPLLDWLRGRCSRRSTACCATPAVAPTYAMATHNPTGLQPGQCMKTCQQTCSRTVVNYVPHTAYRTDWKRVPVTSYRPVTNTDPCTGCVVTCMRPCTTYTYQCQRVPYTTYRPVYRQENYTVPVTTITNDCATGTCGTCNTCNTCPTGTCGGVPGVANYAPTYSPTPAYTSTPGSVITTAPSGTISTDGSFSTGSGGSSAADFSPALDGINPQGSNNRSPIVEKIEYRSASTASRVAGRTTMDRGFQSEAPEITSVSQRLAESSVRQQWSYSTVRLASHTKVVESASTRQPRDYNAVATEIGRTQFTGRFEVPSRTSASTRPAVNSGWESVE